MKNTINLLLKYVYMHIPSEILQETFKPGEVNRSMDILIKEHVIIDYVLQQCNLYAGRTKKILLSDQYLIPMTDLETSDILPSVFSIYRVPPHAREHRPITAILDVCFPSSLSYADGIANNTSTGISIASSAKAMLQTFTRIPYNVTPRAILIDGNEGLVRLEPYVEYGESIISCLLAYDNNFNNISNNLLPPLQKMTLYATQAFVYNVLYVRINQGFLVTGSQLEAIRDVVSKYEDAEERFQEALMKFRGASLFSPEVIGHMVSLML